MSDFATDLNTALRRRLPGRVKYLKGWRGKSRGIDWAGPTDRPVALVIHHTAGAATSSTDPRHKGNQSGANNGVVNFVQNHYQVPAANFTLDRDGTVYVHSAWPVWHAGLGSFRGVHPYRDLGIPDNAGNDWMLGVEVVSKGLDRDFTEAQKVSLGALANACKDAAGWGGFYRRLPNHRTWAPTRKVDSKYDVDTIRRWAVAAS